MSLYEPLPGEVASLYEMGLPIVCTEDKWHVSVGQKIPLNKDRNNVPPRYLKAVRTLVPWLSANAAGLKAYVERILNAPAAFTRCGTGYASPWTCRKR